MRWNVKRIGAAAVLLVPLLALTVLDSASASFLPPTRITYTGAVVANDQFFMVFDESGVAHYAYAWSENTYGEGDIYYGNSSTPGSSGLGVSEDERVRLTNLDETVPLNFSGAPWVAPGNNGNVSIAYHAQPFGEFPEDIFVSIYNTSSGEINEVQTTQTGPWVVPTTGQGAGVALSNDHLYVAAESGGLYVANVSDYTRPSYLQVLQAEGYTFDMAYDGTSNLWVACGPLGIARFDISSPAAPVLDLTLQLNGTANALFLNGTTLFVSLGTYGVAAVDVTDVDNPALLYEVPLEGGITDLSVLGPELDSTSATGRLRLTNLTVPDEPTQLSELNLGRGLYGLHT
jgi:hypothetical protein